MKDLATACLFWAIGTGAHACHEFEDPIALMADEPSSPRAYLELGHIPMSAPFDLRMQYCAPSGQSPLRVSFDAQMPAHMHGMNYLADVSDLGGSVFRVSNIVFHMPGLWRMEFEVRDGDRSHKYTAEIVLD